MWSKLPIVAITTVQYRNGLVLMSYEIGTIIALTVSKTPGIGEDLKSQFLIISSHQVGWSGSNGKSDLLRFIRAKAKGNEAKSEVGRPWDRKLPGVSFSRSGLCLCVSKATPSSVSR